MHEDAGIGEWRSTNQKTASGFDEKSLGATARADDNMLKSSSVGTSADATCVRPKAEDDMAIELFVDLFKTFGLLSTLKDKKIYYTDQQWGIL